MNLEKHSPYKDFEHQFIELVNRANYSVTDLHQIIFCCAEKNNIIRPISSWQHNVLMDSVYSIIQVLQKKLLSGQLDDFLGCLVCFIISEKLTVDMINELLSILKINYVVYQTNNEYKWRATGVTDVKKESSKVKDKKIFISHSSADKPTVELVERLLVDSGIPRNWIVCSSVAGTHIPTGENLLAFLKKTLSNENIVVVFLLSDNFYKSVNCLNEMGATWVKDIKYFSILLNGFKRSDIKGCIDTDEINISLSKHDDLSIARTWDLKRELEDRLSVTLDEIQWQLGWNQLFDVCSDTDTVKLEADVANAETDQRFRMTDAQGYCIGDDYRDGCKVIKRCSSANKTTVQLDFSKTNSNICSIVYPVLETDWRDLYRRPGAKICFDAYYIAEYDKELHAEIELHMNNGNNIRHPLSLRDDTRSFEIPLTSFSDVENMWKHVSEICFLFERRNVAMQAQIIVENLQIE